MTYQPSNSQLWGKSQIWGRGCELGEQLRLTITHFRCLQGIQRLFDCNYFFHLTPYCMTSLGQKFQPIDPERFKFIGTYVDVRTRTFTYHSVDKYNSSKMSLLVYNWLKPQKDSKLALSDQLLSWSYMTPPVIVSCLFATITVIYGWTPMFGNSAKAAGCDLIEYIYIAWGIKSIFYPVTSLQWQANYRRR